MPGKKKKATTSASAKSAPAPAPQPAVAAAPAPAPRKGKSAATSSSSSSSSSSSGSSGSGSGASSTGAKSEEVANTLATLLNMFPQTHAGVVLSLHSTARGSALIHAIRCVKPFADVKAAFVACDPKRDLNAVDDTGNSPLHHAAQRGDVDIVKLLLSGGASMRQSNYDGQMAFHTAAFYGRAGVVNEFLRRGMDVNATNNQGESALLLAAYYNHRDVIGVLLRYDANVALGDFKGNTPLRVSRTDGRVAIHAYAARKEDEKRRADNPVPGTVTHAVNATKPFAAKLAALKLEATAPGPALASLQATAQGGVAQPATAAPSAQRCALGTCGKNDVVLKGCARCRLVAYCTKEHQIADFKEHKQWCLHAKDMRDTLEVVVDPARPPQERAAATQRLVVPFDPTLLVALNTVERLLAALATDDDPKLPSLVALRALLLTGGGTSAVDEDLTARFLLANGLTAVLKALLDSPVSAAVAPDTLLDNARFLMAIARRHRLARLIITHYLSAPPSSASAATSTNPGLTSAAADANVALLCRLTAGAAGYERVNNLSVGMIALLCEVDDLHVHSGLTARVSAHCPVESLKLAQRLLKIDALIASKAAAAVSAANTPARKAQIPSPV